MSPHFTALRCFFLVALHYGVQIAPDKLLGIDEADTISSVLRLMREVGLRGRKLRNRRWDHLVTLGGSLPAMAEQKSGKWVIVTYAGLMADGKNGVAVLSPESEQSGVAMIPREQFEEMWSGKLIICHRFYHITDKSQPFGMRWFMPEIISHGRFIFDVAIASMFSSVLNFALPLFLNIVCDKIIPNQSYQSLYMIIMVYLVVIVLDGFFSYVRQYMTIISSNKIDAKLLSRSFNHLLSLPMQFFESSSSGILTMQMHQTEVIRGFLTGRLFLTMLDVYSLPILLTALGFYSIRLTFVVLMFTAAIAAVSVLMVPIFRRQLDRLSEADGIRQAYLVETIHNIRAVKSLALEPSRKNSWDSKVGSSVRRRSSVGLTCALVAVATDLLQKLMQIAILGFGASDVFDGTLSIGGLVAFYLLSGRVTGPLVQLATLFNEYQQIVIAVRMLGQVMNRPPERDPNQQSARPYITGQLEFKQVTFRYDGTTSPALNAVSFKIEEGQTIGVVGRSGSGKTTVTRMIQGISLPQEGTILLNGNDIRNIDLSHLRRNVGIVLQDNILFRGTILDNIAAGRPESTLNEVMEVARMAGANEFIDRLSRSYETLVEEGGTNFSGGQRQRIAIARALLAQPQLLIFDEATSALDPESEAVIQQNLADIARGRTMLIVSHRLSSLVTADSILVLERGLVVDFAPHPVLIERCDIYRHLWQQQNRHIR